MPLRQTVHFLGACKAKGADGLFLGGNDRHDGALGQRTALGGQGHDLSAVGSFSRAKRQQALFDHGRHGGVQRLLGDAPVRRNAVLGQRLARRHQRIQRPERCVRQAAPLRRRVVQGVALIELAVRFVQQGAGLGFLFFHSLSSLKSDFGFYYSPNIVRNRIYVKCRILMLLFVQFSHCLHPPRIL